MQRFTKTEIKWIINTLNHAINAQEVIIKNHINDITIELKLLKLQHDNDVAVREKLQCVLNSHDKRIAIE